VFDSLSIDLLFGVVVGEEEEEQSSLVGWLRSIAKGEREAGRRRRRRS